ncbi:MAG: 23S rRNA (uracil(1939)-C(5))-methyltransferase RlmD [Clostridia bacterium]|nr:23S rRNA (uracil(1939)-C(5))-methyltransferase RlmD [Clostridia bacterium]
MENRKYCNVCKKCSGCQLSNLTYTDQQKYKQSQLRRTFQNVIKPPRIIPAPSPLNYRNKAQIVFKKEKGKTKAGIYQSAGKGIVLTDNCPLHTDTANEISRSLCKLFDKYSLPPFDFRSNKGFVRSVVIREGFATGEVLVNIVASKNTFQKEAEFAKSLTKAHPYIKSIIITESQSRKLTSGGNPRVIYGKEYITDILCNLEFKIGYNTFYQINPVQTETLYSNAIKLADLKDTDVVLDAYCGIGTISLAAAKKCGKVIGVELNESSIENAKENAALNKIDNAEFYANDVKNQIKTLLKNGEHFDACFVDPPRAGCDFDFMKSLINAEIPKIVYISCNIETQIRDVRFFLKNGYTIEKQQGVDMFPYTKHIESIVLLSKTTKFA